MAAELSTDAVRKTLDSLSHRLQLLEDERDILDCMYRYGHAVDYGLNDEWVDCFTPDGVFDLRRRGRERRAVAGAAALAEFVAGHTNAPQFWHKHLLVEPRITVAGESAEAASYFVRVDRSGEGINHVSSFGRYLDRLRRSPDGRWRFECRTAESESAYKLP